MNEYSNVLTSIVVKQKLTASSGLNVIGGGPNSTWPQPCNISKVLLDYGGVLILSALCLKGSCQILLLLLFGRKGETQEKEKL